METMTGPGASDMLEQQEIIPQGNRKGTQSNVLQPLHAPTGDAVGRWVVFGQAYRYGYTKIHRPSTP